jgi:uncharacterized GH25 family protein
VTSPLWLRRKKEFIFNTCKPKWKRIFALREIQLLNLAFWIHSRSESKQHRRTMTRGRWLILALLILLAALIAILVRQKHTSLAVASVSSPTNSAISKPAVAARSKKKKSAKKVFANETAAPKVGRHLLLVVQNDKSQPLSDARIRVRVQGEKPRSALTNYDVDLHTDDTGSADVVWPTTPFKRLEVAAMKGGYAGRKMIWDLETGDTIPQTYLITLKAGFNVGGIVVDAEGNPISDAEISAFRYWSSGDDAPMKKGEGPGFGSKKTTSDSDGKWEIRDLPHELDHIMFEAKSANFIASTVNLTDPKAGEELRAETYKFVLKRGFEISGRVLDEQEKPIAGAQVWAGRKYSRERRETKTDEEGKFTLHNLETDKGGWAGDDGKILFSAMADGFAPETLKQKIDTNAPAEIIFHLKPGAVISGKVVDKQGEPIEKVRVVLEGNSPDGERYESFEFSTTTDKDGKFVWNSAPNQPMPFYIGKMGYQQKRNVTLKSGEENVVTLLHGRQVIGKVLDAETGQPVTQFHIVSGRKIGDQFYGDSYGAKDFTSNDGSFTFEIGEEQNNGIQASAKDYAEKIETLPPAKDEAPVELTIELKPSPALEGTVITPNGQPVSGAKVALVEEVADRVRSVRISNGRIDSFSGGKVVTTDQAGHFSIPSPTETGTVFASAQEGFASASLEQVRGSGVLTLQLFGRIEGVLLRGDAPAEGQELTLSSPNPNFFFAEGYRVTTDGSGKFSFEKVPAGTWSVARLIATSLHSSSYSHFTPVTVAAGQTAYVTLGGVDATLQGHVSFGSDSAETDLRIFGSLSTTLSPLPAGLSGDELRKFYSSPEWKEQLKTRKFYSVVVGKDGSVNLDSVAPGDYTLTITAQKASDESFNPKPVARGETKITVPVGSTPSAPIDLGEIVLKPVSAPASTSGVWIK